MTAARTLAGLQWAVLDAGAQALLGLGIIMVTARLLPPQDFGLLAAAQVFVMLADTLGRNGVGPALIQRFEITEGHLAAGFSLSLAAGAALAAVLWGLAPLLALAVGEPDLTAVLRALALATLLTGAGVVSEHRLRRELRFAEIMAASLVAKILGSGCVAITLALAGYGVWSLVWGAVARQAAFTIAVAVIAPPPRFALGMRESAELLRTAVGFSLLALFRALSGQAIKLIVAAALGAASLGLYSRAQALSVVTARLAPLLPGVLFPAISQRQDRIRRLRAAYLHCAEMLALIAVPAGLALAVSAPEIVATVLGENWSGAVPPLRILALAGAATALGPLHTPLVRAMGAVYRESWRRLLALVLILALAWFASRWGLAAVVAAVSAVRIVENALIARLALDLLDIRPAMLLRRMYPTLWTACWATAAVSATAVAAHAAAWAAPVALAAQVAVWVAATLAALYFAPVCARPAFPRWALGRLPLRDLGLAGRLASRALQRLGRHRPSRAGPGQPFS